MKKTKCLGLIVLLLFTCNNMAANPDSIKVANFLLQEKDGVSNYTILTGRDIFDKDWMKYTVGYFNYEHNTLEGIYLENKNIHGHLDLKECTGVEFGNIINTEIETIQISHIGIFTCENNEQLTSLHIDDRVGAMNCNNNKNLKIITSRKLIEETLGILLCHNNAIEYLDPKIRPRIKIRCENNKISSIDLTSMHSLESFDVSNNQILDLEVPTYFRHLGDASGQQIILPEKIIKNNSLTIYNESRFNRNYISNIKPSHEGVFDIEKNTITWDDLKGEQDTVTYIFSESYTSPESMLTCTFSGIVKQPWKKEKEINSIETEKEDSYSIYVNSNELIIKTNIPQKIQVYNIEGRLIYTNTILKETFVSLNKGIYIIKPQKGKNIKVAIP